MANADGQLNGQELGVYISGTGLTELVAYSTNATLNINHNTRSTSSKESGGWEESMEGIRSWDISCDAHSLYTCKNKFYYNMGKRFYKWRWMDKIHWRLLDDFS